MTNQPMSMNSPPRHRRAAMANSSRTAGAKRVAATAPGAGRATTTRAVALATIATIVATTLAACAVGPNYKRPETPVAQQFAGAEPSTYQTAQQTPVQFWKQF